MSGLRKKIIMAVVLVFAGLFGWRVYGRIVKARHTGGPSQAGVAVEVTPVVKSTIRDVKQFTGSLQPHSQFIVAPKVAGRLEKIFVDMGDSVKRGQLIAELDSQEYVQEVEQARAELEVARASVAESMSALDVAKREFERIRVLRDKKIASESELDQAEASYKVNDARLKVAGAQVEQKQAALKAAEVRLSFTQIRASWEDGSGTRVVGEKYVDEGTMLRANDSIVSILDIDSIKAKIYVAEEDYSMVHTGQSVVLTTDAYAGREFTGTIVRMAPALKESSRAADIEVAISNPKHLLKPGMFVRAEIEMARREGVTVVPFAALVKRDEKQGVFLLNRGEMKVSFVPVKTGIVTADLAEIVQPAIEGYVVTLGQHLLDDGSSVVLPEEEKEKSAVPHNSGVPGRIRDKGSRP